MLMYIKPNTAGWAILRGSVGRFSKNSNGIYLIRLASQSMKRHAVAILLVLAISRPVGGAETQSDQSSGRQPAYPPRLAVVMELIQLSHFKLWLAGNLRNWPLAEYELTQMKATLQDVRTLFPDLPGADTSAMSQSADEFVGAIRAKNDAKFDAAFKKFTSECNSCHEQRGLLFIKIKIPSTSPIMTSPLSNQSFGPQ
jgi:hypothetical protein